MHSSSMNALSGWHRKKMKKRKIHVIRNYEWLFRFAIICKSRLHSLLFVRIFNTICIALHFDEGAHFTEQKKNLNENWKNEIEKEREKKENFIFKEINHNRNLSWNHHETCLFSFWYEISQYFLFFYFPASYSIAGSRHFQHCTGTIVRVREEKIKEKNTTTIWENEIEEKKKNYYSVNHLQIKCSAGNYDHYLNLWSCWWFFKMLFSFASFSQYFSSYRFFLSVFSLTFHRFFCLHGLVFIATEVKMNEYARSENKKKFEKKIKKRIVCGWWTFEFRWMNQIEIFS